VKRGIEKLLDNNFSEEQIKQFSKEGVIFEIRKGVLI
jgi:hypothetical protein